MASTVVTRRRRHKHTRGSSSPLTPCGWTLARAHARSGDAVSIAAYLGDDDAFDKSITDFSERYAAQNDQDFAEFAKAISSNRIEAVQQV